MKTPNKKTRNKYPKIDLMAFMERDSFAVQANVTDAGGKFVRSIALGGAPREAQAVLQSKKISQFDAIKSPIDNTRWAVIQLNRIGDFPDVYLAILRKI